MLLAMLALALAPAAAQDQRTLWDGRCSSDSYVFGAEQSAPGYVCGTMVLRVLDDDPRHVMYFFRDPSAPANLFSFAGWTQDDGSVTVERVRFGAGTIVAVSGSCRSTADRGTVTRVQCNVTATDGSSRKAKIDFAVQ